MSELMDYKRPCGCSRHTERDDSGEVLWIDESVCWTHMGAVWERLAPPNRKEEPMISLNDYQHIIEQRKKDGYWTVHDMIDGETVPRSYGPGYKPYAATKAPRNFSLIPDMIELLTIHPRPGTGTLAIEHLNNAANEDLPEDVRTEHYDIAGVHIAGPGGKDFSHPAFTLWVKGNGA